MDITFNQTDDLQGIVDSLADAGILVTIDDLTVQPGYSQATVDVWIESEAGSIA